MEFSKLGLDMETTTKDKRPLIDDKLNNNVDNVGDMDYNHLILKLDHFEQSESSNSKLISYAEETLALVNQTLCDIIREAYIKKPG